MFLNLRLSSGLHSAVWLPTGKVFKTSTRSNSNLDLDLDHPGISLQLVANFVHTFFCQKSFKSRNHLSCSHALTYGLLCLWRHFY
jgi:hypothetical protein